MILETPIIKAFPFYIDKALTDKRKKTFVVLRNWLKYWRAWQESNLRPTD